MVEHNVSCIVSAYKQPEHLLVCLASLRLQRESTKPWDNIPLEIVVVDDANLIENKKVADYFGCKYITTDFGCCYNAAEVGVKATKNRWLCFPSHDNWYVPEFIDRMMNKIYNDKLQLVYCDLLHDPRYTGKYEVVETKPEPHHVDKGGIVVDRITFEQVGGFTGKAKTKGKRTAADGILVEAVNKDYRTGRLNQPLFYHG